MITGPQIRAARQQLRWKQQQLAKRAGVRLNTIERAERANGQPEMTIANLAAIRRALEAAGVDLTASSASDAGSREKAPTSDLAGASGHSALS
jgi:transcriptional regulator with XRE-family HTH domain